jgi:hypothetical protein
LPFPCGSWQEVQARATDVPLPLAPPPQAIPVASTWCADVVAAPVAAAGMLDTTAPFLTIALPEPISA